MNPYRRFSSYVLVAFLATCVALTPGATSAEGVPGEGVRPSFGVDEIFAVDYFGAVKGLRIVGSHLDSGNLMSVTLGGEALEIESSTGTEIVARLPEGFAPGTYEMAVSVEDEVNRVAHFVGLDIFLPREISTFPGKSHHPIWTSQGGNRYDDSDPTLGESKAISSYFRRGRFFSCRNNFYCSTRTFCPSRHVASGGGMSVSGTNTTRFYLMESYPSTNSSWGARGLNQSGATRIVAVWAACIR